MTEQRLYLGSCADVVLGLGARYGFVIADPPYSRAGGAHTSSSNAAGRHASLSASDQFWEHWFTEQWRAIATVTESWACAMVFCDYRTIGALERSVAAADCGWTVSQCAIWDRGSIGLGSPMRARHEMIAFCRGPEFKWDGRKDIPNVFRCDWPYGSHPNHPSEKPVPLLTDILRDFARGHRVLDPFCGSASSGVAARSLGLDWDGIEQDAETAKVAAERLGQRIKLLGPTVVRRMAGESGVYLMNRQKRGWSECGIPLKSVRDVEVFYHVTVGEWSVDDHGEYAPVALGAVVPMHQTHLVSDDGRQCDRCLVASQEAAASLPCLYSDGSAKVGECEGRGASAEPAPSTPRHSNALFLSFLSPPEGV